MFGISIEHFIVLGFFFLHLAAICAVVFSNKIDTSKKILYFLLIWMFPVIGMIAVYLLSRRENVNLIPFVKG